MDVQEIDGASNTGVDDVREIRERIKYLPSHGKYKVYIIDEVHMLSTAAFNALLKTLEEPPAHVIFVFATTEAQKIPTTILSRCQRYDFRRVTVSVIADSVKKIADSENINVDPDALLVIANEAEGSMRDAQSLFDQAVAFSGKDVTYEALKGMLGFMDRSQLRALLLSFAEKDAQRSISIVGEIFDHGGNLLRLSQELLMWVRSLLVFRATKDGTFLKELPAEDSEFITQLAHKLDVSEWEQMFRLCYRQTEELTRSKYPKMIFEALCVQLSHLRPVVAVDDILDKIDGLVSGAGRPASPTVRPVAEVRPVVVATEKIKAPISPVKDIPNPAERKTIGEGEWKNFLKWLNIEKPQLSSILEHGLFAGGGVDVVHLQYSKSSIYGEMLKEPHRKEQLEVFVAKHFGKKYVIDFKMSADEIPAHEAKKVLLDEKKERSKKLKEETLSNDMIKEAANILEADIREIRVKE